MKTIRLLVLLAYCVAVAACSTSPQALSELEQDSNSIQSPLEQVCELVHSRFEQWQVDQARLWFTLSIDPTTMSDDQRNRVFLTWRERNRPEIQRLHDEMEEIVRQAASLDAQDISEAKQVLAYAVSSRMLVGLLLTARHVNVFSTPGLLDDADEGRDYFQIRARCLAQP